MKVEYEAETNFLKTDTIPTSPEIEVITENCNLNENIKTNEVITKESKLNKFWHWLGDNWIHFINWIKKSIAMMIVFMMIGCAGGLYIAKWIYDFRMYEITKVGGFVHDGRVYDAKLRP